MNTTVPDEILWRHVSELPYFRAMVRACEDHFYQGLELPRPVLDLGCGDAHFASKTFRAPLDVGLDPWAEPLQEARTRQAYCLIIQSDGGQAPFDDGAFATVISNSVLEHIPHVDRVIAEVARVLRPGGRFIFCVPNQRFPQLLAGAGGLRRVGLNGAAEAYTRLFQRISRHVHCDSFETWRARLDAAGFSIDEHWDYFDAKALRVMEFGHAFGMPALISRRFLGRWILVPAMVNLGIPFRLARRHMRQPVSEQGVYSFYITHRNA